MCGHVLGPDRMLNDGPPPFAKRLEPSCCVPKVDPQATLWESLAAQGVPPPPAPGLCAVDAFLDDPVFFEPFVRLLRSSLRPALGPVIETYFASCTAFSLRPRLRDAVGEVTDSLSWARFAGSSPYDKVPRLATALHAHEDPQALWLRGG